MKIFILETNMCNEGVLYLDSISNKSINKRGLKITDFD